MGNLLIDLNQSNNKRDILLEEIKKVKYSYIEITESDKKANELYNTKVVPNFKFEDDFYFDLAMKYKSQIESHPLFTDLKQMPKGCLLHHHIIDCINIKWLSDEVMKLEHLKNIYMRKFRDIYDILIYTKSPNLDGKEPDKPFKDIIETYLKNNKDKTPFDYFYEKLSMVPEEVSKARNNTEAWNIFMPKYFFCYYLVHYKEFYRQHIRNAFNQCLEDKQYRLESRLSPGIVRDEFYNYISEDEEMAIYQEELNNVNKNNNSKTKFTFGIIVEIIRNKTDEFINQKITSSIKLREKYPDLICGIDLSGDEDHFRTFQELTPVMLTNTDPNLPWILHCGESLKAKNYNLIDGLLVNAKRFGHCINFFKIGNLVELIKSKNMVLEINPISNQTLRQVRDLRLHPCIGYHNRGIKICINNDDPTLYNTKGVNYDYFVAAVAMEFDLIDLKCFGLNSIDGAMISDELKNDFKKNFLNEWIEFVDYFIRKYEKQNKIED